VVSRSLYRAASGRDVFPGCREGWDRLLTREHPIRWAWDTYARRRRTFSDMIADPAHAHLRVHQARSRREVAATLDRMIATARAGEP
jgi:hypothetical protein